MKDIVIIGAGGFGREVQWLLERINEQYCKEHGEPEWNILGYIDDGVKSGTQINDLPVLGTTDELADRNEVTAVACAIGSSKVRKRVIEKIKRNKKLIYPNLIDPSVLKSDRITWGEGNIICAGNILTVNITVENFCIINLDCTIGHDAILGSYTTIYPSVNVSGCVRTGECVELGTGVQVIQGREIGENTIIGAGAVVVKDIPQNCTAVGAPCQPIKFHND